MEIHVEIGLLGNYEAIYLGDCWAVWISCHVFGWIGYLTSLENIGSVFDCLSHKFSEKIQWHVKYLFLCEIVIGDQQCLYLIPFQ